LAKIGAELARGGKAHPVIVGSLANKPAVRGNQHRMNKPKHMNKHQLELVVGQTPPPLWARLPRGKETLEGIRRGHLYRLIGAGKIRSLKLCEPGAKRGIHLIDVASLREFLANAATQQASGEEVAK
jgi:hypothetical protein